MYPLRQRINDLLVRWACRKFKRFPATPQTCSGLPRRHRPSGTRTFRALGHRYQTHRLDNGSRVNREVYARFYARFYESPRVQFPWATHQCSESSGGSSDVVVGLFPAGKFELEAAAGEDRHGDERFG